MSKVKKIVILILAAAALILFWLFSQDFHPTVLVLPHNPIFREKIKEIIIAHQEQIPQLILIFSPNHQDVGSPVITDKNWLGENLKINADESLIKNEHGISVMGEVVKEIYPQGQIIPFAFRRAKNLQATVLLAEKIKKEIAGEKTLIIASVDFAHYLDFPQSEANNRQAWEALEKGDYATIMQFGSDYFDCPECLVAASVLAEEGKPVILQHQYFSGTSYIFGILRFSPQAEQ